MIYLEASDFDQASDRKKISLLLSAIGEEGIALYNTFTFSPREGEEGEATERFLDVVQKFDDHFLSTINVTLERHLFFVRDQEVGETIDRYVLALRTLAKTCEFSTLTDALIRDRLVCGLRDHKVRERLLQTSNLTLQKVIDTCRALETARKQARG
eukprot:m.251331 g.251331  ORF g.251331 m.251331 type:complete len:156 (+) comp40334_c0_seq6:269-736(+)